MIEQFFESKRPKKSYFPTHYPVQQGNYFTATEHAEARLREITVAEYRRRDKLILDAANACRLETGDKAYPIDAKKYEKYGMCTIIYVVRTYKDMGKAEEWPKNDNPFIIGFRPATMPNDTILCTNGFLDKENRHLKVTA